MVNTAGANRAAYAMTGHLIADIISTKYTNCMLSFFFKITAKTNLISLLEGFPYQMSPYPFIYDHANVCTTCEKGNATGIRMMYA